MTWRDDPELLRDENAPTTAAPVLGDSRWAGLFAELDRLTAQAHGWEAMQWRAMSTVLKMSASRDPEGTRETFLNVARLFCAGLHVNPHEIYERSELIDYLKATTTVEAAIE
jgi:hypothetical protein